MRKLLFFTIILCSLYPPGSREAALADALLEKLDKETK